MLVKGIMTQMSGSLGGITAGHAKGGMYLRARAIPVNPNTGFQVQVRAAMTMSVNRWTETLTSAQRNAWNTYGANTPTVNRVGDTINLSGQQWYNAANVPRGQALSKLPITASTLTPVDDAPVIFDRGDFTTPSMGNPSTSIGAQLTFGDSDSWVSEPGSALLVYQGRPHNGSRTYFGGPWRLIHVIQGSSGTPPTSPATITVAEFANNGFALVAGQFVPFAYAVTRADGRISTRRQQASLVIQT